MIRLHVKYLIFSISVLVSSMSLSDARWHTSKVARVYPLSDGAFVITFQNFTEACTNGDKYFYVQAGQNGASAEGVEKMYSLAMTAGVTGKDLSINFDSTSLKCFVNRMSVDFSVN